MKTKKRPIRKKPFLLLEVLIAFIFVTLMLFPLIRPLLAIRKEELKHVISLELERQAKNQFILLKKLAYEGQFYDFETLYSSQKAIKGDLEDTEVSFQKTNKTYKTKFLVEKQESFRRRSKDEAALVLLVTIYFEGPHIEKKTRFSFPMLVEKKV